MLQLLVLVFDASLLQVNDGLKNLLILMCQELVHSFYLATKVSSYNTIVVIFTSLGIGKNCRKEFCLFGVKWCNILVGFGVKLNILRR